MGPLETAATGWQSSGNRWQLCRFRIRSVINSRISHWSCFALSCVFWISSVFPHGRWEQTPICKPFVQKAIIQRIFHWQPSRYLSRSYEEWDGQINGVLYMVVCIHIIPPSLPLLLLSFRSFYPTHRACVQVSCRGGGAWTNYAVCGTCKPGELNRGPSPPRMGLLSVPSWDGLGLVSARKSDGQARPVAGSQDIWADTRVGNAAGRGSPGAAAVSTAKHGSRQRNRWWTRLNCNKYKYSYPIIGVRQVICL